MEHTLPPLPSATDALQPHISKETLEIHHGKHHNAYVVNLNNLIKGTEFEELDLEAIVRKSQGGMFNNAAQVWNHDFYWRSMNPTKTKLSGKLASAITRDFGGTAELIAALAEAGKTQFGSGWAWLVSKDGKLSVEKTGNAMTPMAKGTNCLLTVDVWEHAYYLDYQNERPKYLESLLGKIINWDYAAENLSREGEAVRAAAE